MHDAALNGRICWYDLMTTDPAAAIAFYRAVIGWETTAWDGGDPPYLMWTNEDTKIGGLMQLPEEAATQGTPSHWLPYVLVSDIAATAQQVTELGGSIFVPPTDIPEVGSFSVFADPQGAMMATFAPSGDPPGHDGPWEAGEFSWHELATNDYEKAFEFYATLFGWQTIDTMDMGEDGIYHMFGRAGQTLGGMFNNSAAMPGPPAWLCYTNVDDAHRAVEAILELGGTVHIGPMEVPGGDMIAQCVDPQGAAFAVHSRPSAA